MVHWVRHWKQSPSVVAVSPLKQQAKQNIGENNEAYCFPEAFRLVIRTVICDLPTAEQLLLVPI